MKASDMIYTAVIINNGDPAAAPWVSSFSSQEKRDAYIEKVKKRVDANGLEYDLVVVGDSGNLDSTEYLQWLETAYGEPGAWTLTDDDSCQHVRKESENTFSLIECGLCNKDPDRYEVYMDTVHLPDYQHEEVLMILQGFGYKSLRDVHFHYGDEANQVIAECIFEHYGSFAAARMFEGSDVEARAYIETYIKEINP